MKMKEDFPQENIQQLYAFYDNCGIYVDMQKTKEMGFVCQRKEVE